MPSERDAVSTRIDARSELSFEQLRPTRLPLALARLHAEFDVGARVGLTVAAATDSGAGRHDEAPVAAQDGWRPQQLRRVAIGAGFGVTGLSREGARLHLRATRKRTLADLVAPGMRLLVCGLNPSEYAADAGVPFARPGNRFWPAAIDAGLVSVSRDPWAALSQHGIGFTDIVKRATPRADALSGAEYRRGFDRLRWLVGWLRPAAVCFVGLAGWRSVADARARAGPQAEPLAGTPTYVMPSTSGVNGSCGLAALTEHLRAAACLAIGNDAGGQMLGARPR